MSDLIALSRLALIRSRWLAGLSLCYLITVILAALISVQIPWIATDWWKSNVAILLLIAALPTLLTAYAAFGFGEEKDLDDQATGYPAWLLRTPIASWKLAVVPNAMKTAWVLLICGLIFSATRFLGTPMQRWFAPGLAISIVGAAICTVGWRPFGWKYTRLTLLALSILPGFLVVMYSAAYAFVPRFEIAQIRVDGPDHWFNKLVLATTCTVYALVVWMSIRSLRLARCNIVGRVSENSWSRSSGGARSHSQSQTSTSKAATFDAPASHSPIRATLSYHFAMLRNLNSSKLILAAYIILLLFACMANTADVAGLCFLSVLTWMAGGLLTEVTYAQIESGRLPNLIASSPISSATFAWTRQLFVTLLGLSFMLGIPAVLGVWYLLGTSEGMIRTIQQSLEFSIGQDANAARALIAAALLGTILVTRQTTWAVITICSSNRRLGLYWFATSFLFGVVALSVFMIQFMKFPDWEAWRSWAGQTSNEYGGVIYVLAITKGVIALWALKRLTESRLTSNGVIAAICTGYLAVVITTGFIVSICLPFPALDTMRWIAIVALIAPLSRILIAPVVLASNRHR